jgi:diguanylate cyclase (GGDEF)-like protein
MEHCKTQKMPLSLIMLDIDFFKKINDELGHIKGDFVLEKVAEILKDNSRKNDLIGRYGGEEFIMVLPKVNIENANFVAEKLRKKVEDSNILKDKKITISLGISLYENEESIKDFIEKSDLALYEAKKTRNKCVVYSKNLKDES